MTWNHNSAHSVYNVIHFSFVFSTHFKYRQLESTNGLSIAETKVYTTLFQIKSNRMVDGIQTANVIWSTNTVFLFSSVKEKLLWKDEL